MLVISECPKYKYVKQMFQNIKNCLFLKKIYLFKIIIIQSYYNFRKMINMEILRIFITFPNNQSHKKALKWDYKNKYQCNIQSGPSLP